MNNRHPSTLFSPVIRQVSSPPLTPEQAREILHLESRNSGYSYARSFVYRGEETFGDQYEIPTLANATSHAKQNVELLFKLKENFMFWIMRSLFTIATLPIFAACVLTHYWILASRFSFLMLNFIVTKYIAAFFQRESQVQSFVDCILRRYFTTWSALFPFLSLFDAFHAFLIVAFLPTKPMSLFRRLANAIDKSFILVTFYPKYFQSFVFRSDTTMDPAWVHFLRFLDGVNAKFGKRNSALVRAKSFVYIKNFSMFNTMARHEIPQNATGRTTRTRRTDFTFNENDPLLRYNFPLNSCLYSYQLCKLPQHPTEMILLNQNERNFLSRTPIFDDIFAVKEPELSFKQTLLLGLFTLCKFLGLANFFNKVVHFFAARQKTWQQNRAREYFGWMSPARVFAALKRCVLIFPLLLLCGLLVLCLAVAACKSPAFNETNGLVQATCKAVTSVQHTYLPTIPTAKTIASISTLGTGEQIWIYWSSFKSLTDVIGTVFEYVVGVVAQCLQTFTQSAKSFASWCFFTAYDGLRYLFNCLHQISVAMFFARPNISETSKSIINEDISRDNINVRGNADFEEIIEQKVMLALKKFASAADVNLAKESRYLSELNALRDDFKALKEMKEVQNANIAPGVLEAKLNAIIQTHIQTNADSKIPSYKEEIDALKEELKTLQAKNVIPEQYETINWKMIEAKIISAVEAYISEQHGDKGKDSINVATELMNLRKELQALKEIKDTNTVLSQSEVINWHLVEAEINSAVEKHIANRADTTENTNFDDKLNALRAELKALRQAKESATNYESVDWSTLDAKINAAIAQYNSDRTGMPDFALESAGGSIISTRCSETYPQATRVQKFLNIPLWYTSYGPRTVIQRSSPSLVPGECWAFSGGIGFLTIELSHPLRVTVVSYEHISKSLTPDGMITSAPNDITFYAYKDPNDIVSRVKLGSFRYDAELEGIQFFDIKIVPEFPVKIIELQVDSNYGAPYTCLYRLRVHGHIIAKDEP